MFVWQPWDHLVIPPASRNLKGGYTGFTSSVRLSVHPSVRPSFCGVFSECRCSSCSSLYNGNSYTDKTTSLYWIGSLLSTILLKIVDWWSLIHPWSMDQVDPVFDKVDWVDLVVFFFQRPGALLSVNLFPFHFVLTMIFLRGHQSHQITSIRYLHMSEMSFKSYNWNICGNVGGRRGQPVYDIYTCLKCYFDHATEKYVKTYGEQKVVRKVKSTLYFRGCQAVFLCSFHRGNEVPLWTLSC